MVLINISYSNGFLYLYSKRVARLTIPFLVTKTVDNSKIDRLQAVISGYLYFSLFCGETLIRRGVVRNDCACEQNVQVRG